MPTQHAGDYRSPAVPTAVGAGRRLIPFAVNGWLTPSGSQATTTGNGPWVKVPGLGTVNVHHAIENEASDMGAKKRIAIERGYIRLT